MARTFNEIAQSIFDDKNSRPELNSLSSSSKAAVFRNWVFVASNAQQNLETIQDRFETEIDEKIRNNFIGTPQWLIERTNEFQLGDDLVLVNNFYQYPSIDASKQIIEASAINEHSGGTVTIKVAKDSSGDLVALSEIELTQLRKYISKIKLAGTRVSVISQNADQLVLSGTTVYYDAIHAEAKIKTAVETALNDYMKNLPFNGKLKLNDVIDVIQKVQGVDDVAIVHLMIKTGFSTNTVNRVVELPSGYLNEGGAGISFDDLITYVGG